MRRVAVHLVVVPHAGVGAVHARHDHAVAGQIGVPAGALAVLDGEELVLHGRAQDVALTRGVHGPQREAAGLGDLVRRGPSQGIALIERVAHGRTAVVVVAAAGHHVPAAGVVALATALVVVGVVEVGQTQHMAELVSHRADTLDSDGARRGLEAVELGRAGIAVDALAVIAAVGPAQVGCVGPQVAGIVARVARRVTGNQEVHHVDLAVVVVVILREVHIGVGLLQRIVEDGRRHALALVGARLGLAVGTIAGAVGTHHVKGGLERAVGLVVEVVVHTAGAAHVTTGDRVMVAREILAAEHRGVERLRVVHAELLVREVDQHHQTAEVLQVKVRQVHVALGAQHMALGHCHLIDHLLGQLRQQSLLGGRAHVGIVSEHAAGHQMHAVALGVLIGARLGQHDGVTVGCSVKVIELVAVQADRDQCSIGLRHQHAAGVGRRGQSLDECQGRREQ